MTTFGFEFIRSDRPLELSHSPDRAARNRLRGDDYMRGAGLLRASRGTEHHTNLA
jgi:hypothetical protein